MNLQNFVERARKLKRIQTVYEIFGEFEAVAGHHLFQADSDSKTRKKEKEAFIKQYRFLCCRINVFVCLKFVSGETYIKMILKRIEWQKKAVIIDIDGNQPVFLDRDIHQSDISDSF